MKFLSVCQYQYSHVIKVVDGGGFDDMKNE